MRCQLHRLATEGNGWRPRSGERRAYRENSGLCHMSRAAMLYDECGRRNTRTAHLSHFTNKRANENKSPEILYLYLLTETVLILPLLKQLRSTTAF